MKHVAAIITGLIGGGLIAMGVIMAYKKQLEDDLTIIKVKDWANLTEVDNSNVEIDMKSKKIFLYRTINGKRELLRPFTFTGSEDCVRCVVYGKHYVNVRNIYLIVFKHMDSACEYLEIPDDVSQSADKVFKDFKWSS